MQCFYIRFQMSITIVMEKGSFGQIQLEMAEFVQNTIHSR